MMIKLRKKMREYFDELFNEESKRIAIELDYSFVDTNKRFILRIEESEIKEPLKMMKTG
jgi:hypothetical protein